MLAAESGSNQSDPLIGRTVGGSYTIQEIVGVGGMGRVYRAEQGTLGRTVAVKVIHPHLLGDEQTVARFYSEARTASRLNHPNSVGIIDFGRTEDGILYLVMEFLKGQDLATVMHHEGPLPFPRIAEILSQTLDALGEAHALDIVHRDLKPENIIIRRFRNGTDLVKVVDFGLATIVDSPSNVTRPGLVCGTPDYMSPEQARGEDVDGRGDLYSLGVMLFELLTEHLPFTADTPTKVVLKHISDPVPDPREVAPHRDIPIELAEISTKALQKDRDHRFRDAAEMQSAIRKAKEAILARKRTVSSIQCGACGTSNPAGMRFCGSCGQPLRRLTPSPSMRPRGPSFFPTLGSQRPLVGRADDVALFEEIRREAGAQPVWVRIEGEQGVGKSRFLTEVGHLCSERGDLVVGAGAHPTGAPVAYGAIRTLVAGLLGLAEDGLGAFVRGPTIALDALGRAGFDELADPHGIHGVDGASRTGAVAAALAAAVRGAIPRATSGTIVLLVDDLARCDHLSQQVLASVANELPTTSLVLVSVGGTRDGASAVAREILLHGLDEAQAQAFLAGETNAPEPSAPPAPAAHGRRRFLPLYLENLQSLGEGVQQDDETLPPRLADAMMQRVDRLSVAARRLLQTASVLGTSTPVDVLRQVGDIQDLSPVDELVERSLVSFEGTRLVIANPFLAELVEASIPASARRSLHQKAMQAMQERSAPIEVVAEHAYRAGEPMRSLMVLERMGDLSLRRGDPYASVLAYRRAHELARRETLETGDTVMDSAILTFSRKLGEALAAAGDLAGADGVLREAMDLTAPVSDDRAKMYLALGRLAVRRHRNRDAMRHFGLALELVAGVNASVESRVQVELGRLRRLENDPRMAGNAYRRALELFETTKTPPNLVAEARIELGQVLTALGEYPEAAEQLLLGERSATEAGTKALAARALAAYGELEVAAGRKEAARLRYERAAAAAAEAGDATSFRAFRGLAASLAA